MANPIETLKGQVVTNDVPLPAPMPASPPPPPPTILPNEVNQGLMPPPSGGMEGEVPPHLGGMEGGEEPFLVAPEEMPGFEAQKLQAPTQTGNQQAIGIIGPRIQQDIQGLKFEAQQSMEGAMSPDAVDAPRTWEPPDLDAAVTRFGYNSKVLSESFKRQVAQRQNADERAWLERNMAAIEAMAQPNTSPTANSMAWVGEILGTSEEGGRSYVRPVVWSQSKGEWQGSPVGGVLYALGIAQNSAVGAFLDITNMASNLDRGLRQAYETFTPPWLRGSIQSSLSRLEPLMKGGALKAHTPGVSLPSTNKYRDGKSNFVEALRGAQFSFSDKSDRGFGLNYDKGFRLSFDLNDYKGGGKRDAFASGPKWLNNKNTAGIDINPGVIAGIALDVILGGKVDKLVGNTASRLLPKKLPTRAPLTTRTPATSTLEQVPILPKQLEIPFLTGPIPSKKPIKVPLPENLKSYKVRKPAAPPKGDVQQVLPIKQMMQEFGEADRATNPKAYMPGYKPDSTGQLSLRLEGVKTTPLPPLNPRIKVPKARGGGKQLKLDFDALPEAVPPRPQVVNSMQVELLRVADDTPLEALPPSVRGKVLNKLEHDVRTKLADIEVRMAVEPDIGRRFAPPVTREFTPYVPRMKRLSILPHKVDLGDLTLYHGTKVKDLQLGSIDPSEGAAFSELGAAIYLSPDESVAKLAAQAQPSAGLPSVEGRQMIDGPLGDVHEAVINQEATIIDGTAIISGIDDVAAAVAQDFPALKNVNFRNKSLVQIYDTAALSEASASARLQFQQQMTKALREEMIDGVKVGDNVAIYNTEALEPFWKSEVPHPPGTDPYESRAALEDWGALQVESAIAQSNALDAEALKQSMRLVELERGKREAINEVFKDIEYKGLMQHPGRIPTLDEYSRLTVAGLFDEGAVPTSKEAIDAGKVDNEVQILFDRAVEVARNRGLSVDKMANLDVNVAGNYNAFSGAINLNRNFTNQNLNKFETLIHEMAHHEIQRLVPYAGKDALLNEAIVDSVGATVASVLAPKHAGVSRTGFDSFFEYLNSPNSSYAKHADGATITKSETLAKYGELVNRISQDLITDIKGPDFKPPSLSKLNIFGPAAYDNFVLNYHKGRKTLAEAAENHIVLISPNLPPNLQIQNLATNPVTGKINTDVLIKLNLQFADDLPTVVQKPTTLLEKWAEGLSRSKNPLQNKRRTQAQAILEEIQRGGTDYETYLRRLSDLDNNGAKQYSPVIRKQIDAFTAHFYC